MSKKQLFTDAKLITRTIAAAITIFIIFKELDTLLLIIDAKKRQHMY